MTNNEKRAHDVTRIIIEKVILSPDNLARDIQDLAIISNYKNIYETALKEFNRVFPRG